MSTGDPTIEETNRTTVTIHKTTYHLEVHDTDCVEQHRQTVSVCLQNGDLILFVYDFTYKSSLMQIDDYQKLLADNEAAAGGLSNGTFRTKSVMLVGNKRNRERAREATEAEGLAYANQFGRGHMETSAKIYLDVARAFSEALEQAPSPEDDPSRDSPLSQRACKF